MREIDIPDQPGDPGGPGGGDGEPPQEPSPPPPSEPEPAPPPPVAPPPPAPAPAPEPAPPPDVPVPSPPSDPGAPPPPSSGTALLHVQVTDASTGAAIAGATVLYASTYTGTGTAFADGAGVATIVAAVGQDIEVNVVVDGYGNVDQIVHLYDASDHWFAAALGPAGGRKKIQPVPKDPQELPPPPSGKPPGVPPSVIIGNPGSIVPLDDPHYHFGDQPPLPGYTRVTFETRGGVPSFTAQSFSLLDIPGFGPSPSGIITGIVGALVSLFKGSSGTADISKLSYLVNNLGNFSLHLAEVLADFTARAVHTDGQSGGLFDHILGGVLGPIINALAAVIRGGAGDLGKLFGPISDAVKKVISTVRHIYDAWLRPIIRAIDTTRQILRVLEAFHLDWATKADAALGRLEGKLSAPILLAIRKLNEVSGVVNRIVTLDGALQRVTLLRSMVKHAGCVQAAIDGAPLAPAGTYPDKLPPRAGSPDVPTLVSDSRAFARDRSGPLAEGYAEWRAELKNGLAV